MYVNYTNGIPRILGQYLNCTLGLVGCAKQNSFIYLRIARTITHKVVDRFR